MINVLYSVFRSHSSSNWYSLGCRTTPTPYRKHTLCSTHSVRLFNLRFSSLRLRRSAHYLSDLLTCHENFIPRSFLNSITVSYLLCCGHHCLHFGLPVSPFQFLIHTFLCFFSSSWLMPQLIFAVGIWRSPFISLIDHSTTKKWSIYVQFTWQHTVVLSFIFTQLLEERLDSHIRVEEYIQGRSLTITYWRELTQRDPSTQLGYRLTVQVDPTDPSRPLTVLHTPSLGNKVSASRMLLPLDSLDLVKFIPFFFLFNQL